MNKFNRVYIMPHFGLGDIIHMIGGIRYCALIYKEVIVACPKDKIDNIKLFVKDEPRIKIEEPTYWEENIMQKYNVDKIYLCGFHKSEKKLGPGIVNYDDVNIIPDCFYRDLELDPKIRNDCFYFQPTIESEILYNLVKDTKYIFIHNIASDFKLDVSFLNIKKQNYLLINCAMNMYDKEEYYYVLANRFINRYVVHYSKIIENAKELYLLDSSIFAFTTYLDISKVIVKNLYIRGGCDYGNTIPPSFNRILLN